MTSNVVLIKKYFEMDGTAALREIRELTAKDRTDLGTLIRAARPELDK